MIDIVLLIIAVHVLGIPGLVVVIAALSDD